MCLTCAHVYVCVCVLWCLYLYIQPFNGLAGLKEVLFAVEGSHGDGTTAGHIRARLGRAFYIADALHRLAWELCITPVSAEVCGVWGMCKVLLFVVVCSVVCRVYTAGCVMLVVCRVWFDVAWGHGLSYGGRGPVCVQPDRTLYHGT